MVNSYFFLFLGGVNSYFPIFFDLSYYLTPWCSNENKHSDPFLNFKTDWKFNLLSLQVHVPEQDIVRHSEN